MARPDQPAVLTDDAPSARRRPWQVTVAVTLLAVCWFGGIAAMALVLLVGDTGGLNSTNAPGFLLFGLLLIAVFFSLRSTWRGGWATLVVVLYAFLLGIGFEVAGTVMSVKWFFDSSVVPLWTSLLLMGLAAGPWWGGRLLMSPAAKEYAPRWHASGR